VVKSNAPTQLLARSSADARGTCSAANVMRPAQLLEQRGLPRGRESKCLPKEQLQTFVDTT
jgi:hypothetical protein